MIGNGVYETTFTRKLTIDGITTAFKVYRVDVSLLYYNDKNDRISTWINQYNHEHDVKLDALDKEEYNRVIEQFVYNSNPAALEKTKNNIELVNQREAGVSLRDGRVIDGNRRLTCIRMLNRKNPNIKYFETVILDMDLNDNYKRIKTLELLIQHGEEQRIEYNPIDKLVGMYNDIVVNKVLTVEEYSEFTNEPINEVKKHLFVAETINEYLSFIHAPYCYHIARETQIVSAITDLCTLLRQIKLEEKRQQIKEIVFAAMMMDVTGDFRKYIKDLTSVLSSGAEEFFISEQERIKDDLLEKLEGSHFSNTEALKSFVKDNASIGQEMEENVETWTTKSKKKIILSRPSESANKAISAIETIDTRIVERLDDEGKDKFKRQMKKIQGVVNHYLEMVDEKETAEEPAQEDAKPTPNMIYKPNVGDPIFVADNSGTIYSFIAKIKVMIFAKSENKEYCAYFIKENDEIVSDEIALEVHSNEEKELLFKLKGLSKDDKIIYLVFKKKTANDKEISAIFAFNVSISFGANFDI